MIDAAEPSPKVTLRRLRMTGRWLRKAFAALLAFNIGVVALLALLICVAEVGQHLLNIKSVGTDLICSGAKCRHASPEMMMFSNALDSYKAALYDGVVILRDIPPILILWRLWALCRLYERGIVFAPDNVRHIRWIGIWTILWSVVPTTAHLVLALTNADIGGYFKLWSDPSQIVLGLVGVAALLAAQVMQVGRHVEDERSQFV